MVRTLLGRVKNTRPPALLRADVSQSPYGSNQFNQSGDMSIAPWSRSAGSGPSYNAGIAPDGTNTAVRMVDIDLTSTYFYQTMNVTAGQLYALSVFAKSESATLVSVQFFTSASMPGVTIRFDIVEGRYTSSTGEASNIRIDRLNNGWFRIQASVRAIGTGTCNIGFGINDNTGVGNSALFWGPQFEPSDTGARSYQPTGVDTIDGRLTTPHYFYHDFDRATDFATAFGKYGLEEIGRHVRRFNHTPTGAHNLIRNPRGEGTGGTPAGYPDKWSLNVANGLTWTNLGRGVENGIEYTEWRVQGTTGVAGFSRLALDGITGVYPIVPGTLFTLSMYIKMVSITTRGATCHHRGVVSIAPTGTVTTPTVDLATLTEWSRRERSSAIPGGTTSLGIFMDFTVSNTTEYDFVFRIGYPQFEYNAAMSPTVSLPPPGVQDISVEFTRPAMIIEAQTVNRIQNPRLEGAVAGSPGTWPSFMFSATSGAPASGIAQEIVGSGYELGIPYLDVRWFGTATGNNNIWNLFHSVAQSPAATPAQVWTFSVFLRLMAGSFSGVNTFNTVIEEYNAVPALLTVSTSSILDITAAPLALQRKVHTYTTVSPTIATIRGVMTFYYSLGAVIDFTLRIGAPQLEASSFMSTPNLPAIGAAPFAVTTGADLVRFQNTIKSGAQGTVIVRFRTPHVLPTGNRAIVGIGVDSSITHDLFVYHQPSGNVWTAGTGTPSTNTGAGTLVPNTWYTLGVSWKEGEQLYLVIDGVLKASGAYTGGGLLNSIAIGARNNGTFPGSMQYDEADYYPYAMTVDQLIALTV